MVGSTSTSAAGGGGGVAGTKKRERKKGTRGGRGMKRRRWGCARKGVEARGIGEKDAGVAGKGAAPATNFRVRGHCGAGAWLRRRSKRKIDAVHGDEKQRARRDGGPAGKKKRTAKRARKREENARSGAGRRG